MLWISEIPVFDLQRRFRNRRSGARRRFHCSYLSKRLLLEQTIISGVSRLINQGLIFMFLLVALRYVAASIKLSLHLAKTIWCCQKLALFGKGNSYTSCAIVRPVTYSFANCSFQGDPSIRRGVYDQMASAMDFPTILGMKLRGYVQNLCSTTTLRPWFVLFIPYSKNGCEDITRAGEKLGFISVRIRIAETSFRKSFQTIFVTVHLWNE